MRTAVAFSAGQVTASPKTGGRPVRAAPDVAQHAVAVESWGSRLSKCQMDPQTGAAALSVLSASSPTAGVCHCSGIQLQWWGQLVTRTSEHLHQSVGPSAAPIDPCFLTWEPLVRCCSASLTVSPHSKQICLPMSLRFELSSVVQLAMSKMPRPPAPSAPQHSVAADSRDSQLRECQVDPQTTAAALSGLSAHQSITASHPHIIIDLQTTSEVV